MQLPVPANSVNRPLGHLAHEADSGPARAPDTSRPAMTPSLPIAHAVQDADWTATWYSPSGQLMQCTACVAGEYLPATHAVHAVSASLSWYCPTAHAVHLDASAEMPNMPDGHFEHSTAATLEYCATAQIAHVDEAAVLECLPAGQTEHANDSGKPEN